MVNAKNALSLLCRGEWREFIFRMRVYRGEIDLRNATTEDLGLSAERSHEYSNSGGLHLEKVLRALKITCEDSIVDFGSGKGGALITFAKYPFSKITGVELSSELLAIAEKNLKKLNIGNVNMTVGDAADFTDLDGYNYFYFFSPFPAAIMRAVVKNIASSLARKPRKMVIIYFNPEHHDAVVTDSPFVKIQEFHHHQLSYYIYSNVV
jgi:protein-L-isoaspartate O-methyltransferase